MELLHKWNHISLVKRIIVGLILGAALGALLPQASVIGILGTLFVNALKALAPLLVFFLVLHSLSQHKKGAKSNMSAVIVFYLIGTFLAALCAVVTSFLFPSTLILAEQAEQAAGRLERRASWSGGQATGRSIQAVAKTGRGRPIMTEIIGAGKFRAS